MKINNIFKFIIILLIILSCLYILYFYVFPIEEGLSNNCNECQVKPSSNNCIQIQTISNDLLNNNVSIIDTNYIFCPWTHISPNCNNQNNIMSKSERLSLSNQQIKDTHKQFGIDNIQCCSGSIDFYNNYTNNINMLYEISNNKEICKQIDNLDNTNRNRIANNMGYDYLQLRTLCNYVSDDLSLSGLLFEKEIESSGNILKDPNLSIQEIISYEKYKYKLLDICNNIQNYHPVTRLTGSNVGQSYILRENEFLNCNGDTKQKTVEEISFSEIDLKRFEDENFFDVSDTKITTLQDNLSYGYPSSNDLEMELKNLPPIEESSNVPSSIINTYLNTINSFYQKQFNSLIGPRTHAVPQTLQFDNNTLSSKSNTFFVYDDSLSNDISFECEPSVTSHNKFKYCGPTPYFSDFKL